MERAAPSDLLSAVQALLAVADMHAHVCHWQHCNLCGQRSASKLAFFLLSFCTVSTVYVSLHFCSAWLIDATPSSSHSIIYFFIYAGFASQSLLTGLGSVQFVSNLVFVMLVLKERVPPRCMLATFFIVVGNVILVVFGNKASPKYSVAELAGLYRKDSMAAYMLMAYAGGMPAFAAQHEDFPPGCTAALQLCLYTAAQHATPPSSELCCLRSQLALPS